MAYVLDRWTRRDDKGRRVRSSRYGIGARWEAVWIADGKRQRRACRTKDEALDLLVRVAAGEWRPGQRTSFSDYGQRWISGQLHQRESTRDQMETRWRLHIEPALGALALVDITRSHIQSAVASWSSSLSPATVAVVYGYAASILKSAVADGLLQRTPAVRISLPAIERSMVRPLSIQQVTAIAGAVSEPFRAMVWLAAATGLRQGELRGLTVDRVLLDATPRLLIDRQLVSTSPLTFGPPKTARSMRVVALDDETTDLLRRHMARYPHASGLVFTGRVGRPLSRATMAKVWKHATIELSLRERSGWHELRHFHASMLIAAGLSVTAVSDRLGHQDQSETLRTYGHLWHDDEARAVAAIASALWPVRPPQSLQLLTGGIA